MSPAPPAGYSGTPLAKKLGIGPGCQVAALGAPDGYAQWLAPLPPGVVLAAKPGAGTALVHLFCTERADLAAQLPRLRERLAPETPLWVSWPKKASRVPTSITEDVVRELALPLGFVDVKVCAVSEVWSGLKLVVRKALRAR
jgi:hypothetical protein